MNRRQFVSLLPATLALALPQLADATSSRERLLKAIPSSGEQIPVVGMGTWVTFNIGNDRATLAQRLQVLQAFFSHGGGMIDSSPMYGSAEAVMGQLLPQLAGQTPGLFTATKVWTSNVSRGPQEIETSRQLWGVNSFDLLQVHNLLAWETHLETLFEMKRAGKLRYVGITTSHGRRHADLLRIMEDYPIDFVQATYNPIDRAIERDILPLAAERGIAVIANRPFQRGRLIDFVQRHPLPAWAAEIDCPHWPAFMLKYVVSHPAVTCVIPATSRVDHMHENMSALYGRQPDTAMRKDMESYVASL